MFRDGREVRVGDRGQAAAGVDLLPSSRELSSIELSLVGERKREYFLARALADVVDRYDAVLVDCPPNLGLLTVNALCACGEVVVPVDMEDVDALHGAEEVIAVLHELVETGDEIELLGVLRVVVDRRRQALQGHRRRARPVRAPRHGDGDPRTRWSSRSPRWCTSRS